MTRNQAWIDIALLLGLTAAITFALSPLASVLMRQHGLISILIVQGLIILLVLRLLLLYRGQGWLDIGLRPLEVIDIRRAMIALLACLTGNFLLISAAMFFERQLPFEHLRKLLQVSEALADNVPAAAIAPMLLFVGVYEELAARGFLLTRLRTASANAGAAIILSSLIFGLAHAYQGWFGVLQTALIGVVLAFFTLRWQTLWPAILAHATINLLSWSIMQIVRDNIA